jgi:DNA-binding GntR family transcriptional regulator
MEDNNEMAVERLAETIYARIRQDILFGRYDPGVKLKMDALRARYEASVNTIREALARLVAEGFVVAEGQRGFTIAPVTDSELRDITETRILLETQAVRLSLQHADLEWEAAVMSAHYKLAKVEALSLKHHEKYRAELEQYDCEFHIALISGCRSSWIVRFHREVYDHTLRYRSLTHRSIESRAVGAMLQRSQRDHEVIRDAALVRNSDKLVELLKTHIRNGMEFAQRYNDKVNDKVK